MISWFLSVLFILMLIAVGFIIVNYFLRDYLNFYENFGLAIGAGLMINFVNVTALSTFGLKISTVVLILLNSLWVTALYLWSRRQHRALFVNNFTKEKLSYLSIGILLLISLILFVMLYRVLSSGFSSWDEFSFWGKAARMTFVNQNIFVNRAVTVEGSGQPLFWPSSVGSMAIFAGSFVENYIKMLTLSFFASFLVFLYGFAGRFKLEVNEKLLAVLMFVSSSQILIQFSTYLHADAAFMYYYAVGTLLLFAGLVEEKTRKELLLPGFLALSVLVFVKRGGSVLSLISIFSLAIVSLKGLFREGYWKKFAIASIAIVALQLLWSLVAPALGQISSPFMVSKPFEFFYYGLQRLPGISYLVLVRMNNHYYFTTVWFFSISSIILGALFLRRRIYYALATFLILNVAYLLVAYLVMFSEFEINTLGSFERYAIAFLPVCFLAIIVFYNDMKKGLLWKKV